MTPSIKRVNGELQLVEAALCKSLTSQAAALEKLLQTKSKAPKELKSQFNQVFSLIADSVELSSFACFKTNESRREQILSQIMGRINFFPQKRSRRKDCSLAAI